MDLVKRASFKAISSTANFAINKKKLRGFLIRSMERRIFADLIKEKVDPAIKKKWTQIFIEQGERKKRAFYERFLGREEEVLFEQKNKDQCWTGYTSNYMSIEAKNNDDLKNKMKKVKLTGIKNGNLTGNLS